MLRVLFFGMLAQKTGCKEIELDFKGPGLRLSEIIGQLRERFSEMPAGPFMLAVNEEHAGPDTLVEDGDEVAIMPPFSGG